MARVLPVLRATLERNPDLGPRTVSALVMGVIVAVPVLLGGPALVGLCAIAAGVMAWEYRRMTCRVAGEDPPDIGLFAAVPALGVGLLLVAPVWIAVGAVVIGAAAHGLADRRAGRPWHWPVAGLLVIGTACVGFPLLRAMPSYGLETILWIILVVVSTDIGAYAAGRAFGGPKLWPRVSPNKTWAGLTGGIVAAMLTGGLFSWATSGTNAALVCTVSAMAALVAQGGDLAESALKRRFGVKDAGALFPGHGGALDRLDGFLAATLAVVFSTLIHGRPVFVS